MAITKATASSVAPAAAGDLVYGSGTNDAAVLGIGTAGQVLAVNSGATAPEWATVSAGGTNWTLLNAGGTALTGAATVTVSGISSVDKIMILISEASSASASSFIELQINTDTGSNYHSYGVQYESLSTYSAANPSRVALPSYSAFRLGKMASNAGNDVTGTVFLSGCAENGVKAFQGQSTGTNPAGGNGQIAFWQGGYWDNSASVTSISIKSTVGNLDGGTVFVFTSAN
jgi:hypothetical protein